MYIESKAMRAFQSLRRRHLQKQVYWHIREDGDGEFYFSSFINKSGIKGLGAKCLKAICTLADKWGIAIRLWCNVPKLFPYYESFGFVLLPAEYGHDSTIRFFKREPGGQS